ncbi:MAG: hypothetical protein ABSC19_14655 [Syntrophorhabdales bacterium]
MTENGYGSWIRPVSARPSAEISEEERRYETGQDPVVLDIIDIPFIAPAPLLHQTENHIIDGEYYRAKRGELPWEEMKRLVDKPETLWPNGDSTYLGLNDRIMLDTAAKMTGSLVLIQPISPSIHVQTEGAEFGNPRRRVRASFEYHGTNYILIVTDPVAERKFLGKPDGRYPLDESYLCISLGEVHTDNYCYKLVAAVIMREL